MGIKGNQMKEKIKELLQTPEWSQEKLSLRLNVSINTVKSWTRKTNPNIPNKWITPELEKLFDKAGIK